MKFKYLKQKYADSWLQARMVSSDILEQYDFLNHIILCQIQKTKKIIEGFTFLQKNQNTFNQSNLTYVSRKKFFESLKSYSTPS